MKFYGQFSPSVDEVIYTRYFNNQKIPGISLECGAYDGVTENSTKFFEETMGWNTINVEPLPYIYDKLLINRPNSINKKIALSNKNTRKKIRVYNIKNYGINNTNASLCHLPEHKKAMEQLSEHENDYREYEVQCLTYKQLMYDLKIKSLDLFVLDVEGHEYEVIDGMIDATVFPDVFVIEHGHRTPEEITEKLKVLPVNYKLDYISYVNSFFIKV